MSTDNTLVNTLGINILTTLSAPFFARSTLIVADLHRTFATLYAKTPRNFGNLYHDVPTIEYTPISTIRASTPLQVQNLTQNVLFGPMVHGEARDLQVYNAGLWVSVNWTDVLQCKTKSSLGNERRFVLEI